MYAIEIKGLEKYYGNSKVLKGVDLQLEKKGILCITGPSGSGKTTLLRCIAGLERINMGEIKINGQIVFNEKWNVPPNKRNISMFFQNLALWPHMTVYQNLDFAAKSHLKDRERRKEWNYELLNMMQIENKKNEYPCALSGGEQQRVAIARTLAQNSNILLLDEPFNNLNEELRNHIVKELDKWIKKFSTTIVLVTHQYQDLSNFVKEKKMLANGILV